MVGDILVRVGCVNARVATQCGISHKGVTVVVYSLFCRPPKASTRRNTPATWGRQLVKFGDYSHVATVTHYNAPAESLLYRVNLAIPRPVTVPE